MSYSIDYVFDLLGKDALMIQEDPKSNKTSILVDGYQVYTRSLRYALFYQKGRKCVCCGKEGTHFELDMDTERKSPLSKTFQLIC